MVEAASPSPSRLTAAAEQTGKDIAMHIAASAAPGAIRPVSVSRDQVPSELIEKERAIFSAQAADSGKPPEIVAKDGRGTRQQVPGGSDAPRAAVRQESRRNGRRNTCLANRCQRQAVSTLRCR
jgi:hypothetical protein